MIGAVTNWIWPKCDQPLEPISTLCSLSLRALDCMQGAKPAVRENWLEFDQAGTSQSFVRYDASSNDLVYVDAVLEFFVANWSAKTNPHLVAITQVAIKALGQMQEQYKLDNASVVCKTNIIRLTTWVASKDVPARHVPIVFAEEKQQKVLLVEETLTKVKQIREIMDLIEPLVARLKVDRQVPPIVPAADKAQKVQLAEAALKAVKQKNEAIGLLEQLVARWKITDEPDLIAPAADKAQKVQLAEAALKAVKEGAEAFQLLDLLVARWKMEEQPLAVATAALTKKEEEFVTMANHFWPEKELEEFTTALMAMDANSEKLRGILASKKKAYHVILNENKFPILIWKK